MGSGGWDLLLCLSWVSETLSHMPSCSIHPCTGKRWGWQALGMTQNWCDIKSFSLADPSPPYPRVVFTDVQYVGTNTKMPPSFPLLIP